MENEKDLSQFKYIINGETKHLLESILISHKANLEITCEEVIKIDEDKKMTNVLEDLGKQIKQTDYLINNLINLKSVKIK